jgi:hypothetical protein
MQPRATWLFARSTIGRIVRLRFWNSSRRLRHLNDHLADLYCWRLSEEKVVVFLEFSDGPSRVRVPMRAGFTTSELLVGLCWLSLLLLLLGIWGGMGFLCWIALTVGILAVGHVVYRYYVEPIVALHSVPCERCARAGQYKVERQVKRRIWRCACGAQYSFAGPTLWVEDDSSVAHAYMRWKWWGEGKWRPAAPALG